MATGRLQEGSYDFFVIFLDIRCLVKFRNYLKFHGARTAFCRVIEDKMTSANGARPAFAHIGRAPDDFGLNFKSYDFNSDCSGTVLCSAGHRTMREKSKKLSKISIQIGRCPSGHRSVFYESNCHRWEATCICRSSYWICIDISLVKTKNLNSII